MCTKINLLKTLYNPSDYSVDVYLNLIDISSCKLEHFTLHFSFIPDQRRESRLVVHLQLLGANICSVWAWEEEWKIWSVPSAHEVCAHTDNKLLVFGQHLVFRWPVCWNAKRTERKRRFLWREAEACEAKRLSDEVESYKNVHKFVFLLFGGCSPYNSDANVM